LESLWFRFWGKKETRPVPAREPAGVAHPRMILSSLEIGLEFADNLTTIPRPE
jgi:hypothetical protein